MRTHEDRVLALECLRVANQPNASSEQIVRDAERYYAFATGEQKVLIDGCEFVPKSAASQS